MKSPLRNGFPGLVTALIASLLVLALPAAASALPSDRSYEKVSPDEKDSADILPTGYAAAEGDAVAYSSYGAFADDAQGSSAGTFYYSERGVDAWSLDSTLPAMEPLLGLNATMPIGFSEDAKSVIFEIVGYQGPGAEDSRTNLVRAGADGSEELISIGAAPIVNKYWGAQMSADGGTAAFYLWGSVMDVTKGPQPPAGPRSAYAGDGTDMWAVSVLPDGTVAPEGGYIINALQNGISDDGSRIFWRVSGTGRSYAWNESGPTTDLPGIFKYATPDGSSAFVTKNELLPDDSIDPNLYRYDFADGSLTKLSGGDPGGAGVIGVLGVSDDGDQVYFAASGALADGATAGATNIYLRDGNQTTLVATLDAGDGAENWNEVGDGHRNSRVTPGGRTLLFSSSSQLTGSDNAGTEQFYRYDADADALTCVSCDPSGDPPTDDAALQTLDNLNIPGTKYNLGTRNLSTDGSRVFFVSRDGLVNADTNGRQDVYIWEQGPGGGSIDLLSSGTSSSDSLFADASANGDNAYFVTRSQLVGTDIDVAADLYDARVGGGLASQIAPPMEFPCEADDCKPQITEPGAEPSPGTGAVMSAPDAGERCLGLDRKLERAHRKAKRTAKSARSAKQKARHLKRKAKRADGKRAKRLRQKAKHGKRRAKRARKQRRRANHRASSLERRAERCEREASR